jgi:hypothetical protein
VIAAEVLIARQKVVKRHGHGRQIYQRTPEVRRKMKCLAFNASLTNEVEGLSLRPCRCVP